MLKDRDDEVLDLHEPALEESSIELLTQPQGETDSPIHTIHVLDHDSEVLLFLFDFLNNEGYQLSASSNAGDAFEHLARSHPEVLIADMDLPEWTGPELLTRVRAIAPSTRVILTSARPEGIPGELLREVHLEILAKPLQRAALLDAVQRLLAG